MLNKKYYYYYHQGEKLTFITLLYVKSKQSSINYLANYYFLHYTHTQTHTANKAIFINNVLIYNNNKLNRKIDRSNRIKSNCCCCEQVFC